MLRGLWCEINYYYAYFWIEEVEVSYWIIIEDCTDNQNYESIQTSTSSMFTHPFPHCGNTLPRASIICFYHGPCPKDRTWSTHSNFPPPSSASIGTIRAKQNTRCSSVIGWPKWCQCGTSWLYIEHWNVNRRTCVHRVYIWTLGWASSIQLESSPAIETYASFNVPICTAKHQGWAKNTLQPAQFTVHLYTFGYVV